MVMKCLSRSGTALLEAQYRAPRRLARRSSAPLTTCGLIARTAGELSGSPRVRRASAGSTGYSPHVAYGSGQLPWLNGALTTPRCWRTPPRGVGTPTWSRPILRMAGPRLQAAMSGAILLAAWVDFLSLADAVLQQCPSYGVEMLFADMNRVQRLMEPPWRRSPPGPTASGSRGHRLPN